MSRRREIESIIVGTLIGDFEEYYPVCSSLITAEMFTDDFLAMLYASMVSMYADGKPVDISTVIEYNDLFMHQDIIRVCELPMDWNFLHKKVQYNMNVELFGKEGDRKTEVTFDDYVNRFLLMAS